MSQSDSNRRRSPPNTEGMFSLKVDNLSYQTNHDELRRLFDRYGEIGDIHVPRDRWTRRSKGYAFIRFHQKRDAEDAMDELDGKRVDGREIRVVLARYGRHFDPNSRGSERGGDRGGGSGRRRSRSRSRSPRRRRRSPSYNRNGRSSRSRSVSGSRSKSGSVDKDKVKNEKGNGSDRSGSASRSPSQ